MGIVAALFAVVAGLIIAFWSWLGRPVDISPVPFAGSQKLSCVSYAPFRGDQSPFGPDVPIDPRQIEEDLAQLKQVTDCVRTYSVDHGLDQIPGIARQHGMKVMLGLWLSSLPDLSRKQVEGAVALANRFPDVIQSVIVGNEVLLRGEMSATQLTQAIRDVKAQVPMPVTYADVWEFWLRNREVATAVDFITIHILPYWEDIPIPAASAAPHVDAIRNQVVAAFPGKEVFIGEFGWPSAGRMREGALPSPANQSASMHEVLALARARDFRVNLIEAYDQPWKRQLEGTVGGHWGLFDAYERKSKFSWGVPVSNHANWQVQAALGIGLAALIFAAGLTAGRAGAEHHGKWLRIAFSAAVAGSMIGWTLEKAVIESLTIGGWLRSLAWVAVAILAPVVGTMMMLRGFHTPPFARVIGRPPDRLGIGIEFGFGSLLIVLTVLAVEAALGLSFDPRYRDFPFPALTGALVPFFIAKRSYPSLRRLPASAEVFAATALAISAIYIFLNETPQNWQAAWFCSALIGLAFILLPGRDAPS